MAAALPNDTITDTFQGRNYLPPRYNWQPGTHMATATLLINVLEASVMGSF